MARLVVVSRNAALPFALNSAGHEVVVVDDEADVRWGEYVSFAEVVLLDLGDPDACEVLVESLATSVIDPVRVLLLASRAPSWQRVMEGPRRTGTAVLPLPLSMPNLSAALDALLQGPPLANGPTTAQPAPHAVAPPLLSVVPPAPEPAAEAPPAVESPASEPVVDVPAAPAAVPAQVPAPPPTEPDAADPPAPPEPEPSAPAHWIRVTDTRSHRGATSWSGRAPSAPPTAPEPAAVLDDPAPPPETVGPPTHDSDPVEAVESVEPVEAVEAATGQPDPPTVEAPERHDPPAPHVTSVVRSLTHTVSELATVPDTAAVIGSEARRLVPSDACAVLVRDGLIWRVAAGEGLRPLEHRIQLDPDHWLVREVSKTLHGVLLTGGEGQWSELYGAPLSARSHLLAAPLPPVGAILLLAREQEPYTEADLETLLPLADEGGHLLSDALDARRLARLLQPFCDLPD